MYISMSMFTSKVTYMTNITRNIQNETHHYETVDVVVAALLMTSDEYTESK